ncbi:MAG: hypothetical protein GVY10_02055 [Verrucomicrobia bacterium]|jgi:hypothetical protein|nr:hypothetical protein [Verrucomicrobiota bacterium]
MSRLRFLAFCTILGGLAIHLLLLLAPWKEGDFPAIGPDAPGVLYFAKDGTTDPALREQAALLDSAPLFMPTRWNSASHYGEVISLREATDLFAPYPARVRLPAEPPPLLESSIPDHDDPSRASEDGKMKIPAWLLAQYRKQPTRSLSPADRPGSVQVTRLSDSPPSPPRLFFLSRDLASAAPAALWQPPVLHLHLHYGGIVGRAVLRESSGFPAWDRVLAGYFSAPSFTRKLPDGYYQIRVFP